MDYEALFGLPGEVAVVTGAGAGIGRGIAELFARAGASVVVSDLKADTAEVPVGLRAQRVRAVPAVSARRAAHGGGG